MKKVLITVFYLVFALALPVAAVGSLFSVLWVASIAVNGASAIEIASAFAAVVISISYVFTYAFSLGVTRREKKITLKTFIPSIHCAVALAFLLVLNPIGDYIGNSAEYFCFAKKDFSVIEEVDTHGGFVGDGSYSLILDCTANREKALEKVRDWKKLPLSENLELIMYGGEKNGLTYGFCLAEEANMPRVENGYYKFMDRSSESKDSADDTELFDRNSFNFTLAVYDCDSDRLYYFEFDT